MEERDGQKEIRSLLGIGTPVQKVLDKIGPLEGKLFQLSGGSNSGKSRTALLFLEGLASTGLKCAFFDIENSGFYSRSFSRKNLPSNINIYSPAENELFFYELKNAVSAGIQAVVIDYLNLIEGIEIHSVGKKLKEFAEKNNVFVFAALHSRKTSDLMFESFLKHADFSANVTKVQAEIILSVVKRTEKEDVISITFE